jgi:CubicO group peptidase (beta-lactamase class C family)
MSGLAEAFDRIGLALEHHLEHSHAAGAALAITDREEILGVAVRGMADVAAGTPVRPETRFQIGSISKSFSGIVALQEAEAGRLDLHVSVNEILPWLELPEPFGPITLHDLMTHTSGLATGTEDAPTLYGALWLIRRVPPTTAPGERFWYSNDGWKIVGACLERVTGTPIHELLRERLLDPLGMRSSVAAITDEERRDMAVGYEPMRFDRPPQLRHPLAPAPWTVTNTADGSIASTVVDMAAYARLLLDRGDVSDGSGGRILSEEMFRLLTENGVEDGDGGRYAYGLWEQQVDGRRWLQHTGGMVGYTAHLVVSPDDGLGAVILQNGGGSKREVVRHALAAARASLAGQPLPDVWAPPAPTALPDAARYVGTYEGDDGRTLEIVAEDDGLLLTLGPVSVRLERDPLIVDVPDSFLVPHPALERFRVSFTRDEAGEVVEAFHGPTWFRGERYAGSDPQPLPAEWAGYPGFYRNDDPWNPVFRILAQKGRLVMQWPYDAGDLSGDAPLTPLEGGWFAVGEERDPRRVRFLGDAGGMAMVAELNAGRWYRSFEQ